MERLTVYEDYVQTMALLRAARNRISNSLRDIVHDDAHGRECARLVAQLHDAHIAHGLERLRDLHTAMGSRSVEAAINASSVLHRHNRQSARLTRLFETDVSDFHRDPDDFYKQQPDGSEIALPPPAMDPTAPIKLVNLMQKLREELGMTDQRRRRAGTPAPPK